jgi:hypothetical protein
MGDDGFSEQYLALVRDTADGGEMRARVKYIRMLHGIVKFIFNRCEFFKRKRRISWKW